MSQVLFSKFVGMSSENLAAIETSRSGLTESMAKRIESSCAKRGYMGAGAEWLLRNCRKTDTIRWAMR